VAPGAGSGSGAIADVGVFGGSGLYELLDDTEEVALETPYGPPSAPLVVGEVDGRRVAFLPRHGVDHRYPPHRINYRANVHAMRQAGVAAIFGPCASGSLQPHVRPGHFVVLDQFVDRSWGRPDSYWDEGAPTHVSLAHPYDDELRSIAVAACRAEGVTVHETGTAVVIQGPRFSTKAESRWFSGQGWEVINMTQHPEVTLANEVGIPYAAIALITDFDAGLEDRPGVAPVTQDEVFAVMRRNADVVRGVLFRAIAALPEAMRPATGTGAPG